MKFRGYSTCFRLPMLPQSVPCSPHPPGDSEHNFAIGATSAPITVVKCSPEGLYPVRCPCWQDQCRDKCAARAQWGAFTCLKPRPPTGGGSPVPVWPFIAGSVLLLLLGVGYGLRQWWIFHEDWKVSLGGGRQVPGRGASHHITSHHTRAPTEGG